MDHPDRGVALPPLAATFQDSGADHVACKGGSSCPQGSSRRIDRRSQPGSQGKDPPDFIRNSVVQDSTPQPQIQMEEYPEIVAMRAKGFGRHRCSPHVCRER
jgi:hypothetical protein